MLVLCLGPSLKNVLGLVDYFIKTSKFNSHDNYMTFSKNIYMKRVILDIIFLWVLLRT